ncbi:MAG: CPBP family intramembrane metalloprotease [Armatimonadetes bacterium]|nr:CPBP family intramembrane metalloprotease [Armatimonadota bacterium]
MVDRIRRLSLHDRLLLLLVLGWSMFGLLGNYFRLRSVVYQVSGLQFLLTLLLWAWVAGILAWSCTQNQRRLADYGFRFGRGGLGSLAALLILHVYLVMTGKMALSGAGGFLWILVAAGAFMEELVFRVIAIDMFIVLLDRVKGKAFWAILASSALFSASHIPSKPLMQLQGIFISSLISGYVYYKTRSFLLPAWYHAISNGGSAAGILAVVLYSTVAAADRITRGRIKPTPATSATGSSVAGS